MPSSLVRELELEQGDGGHAAWVKRGLNLEWFRAKQISMARQRFERGGENEEWLMLQRIWSYKEKILDLKMTKHTDQTMRSILVQTQCGGNRDQQMSRYWIL